MSGLGRASRGALALLACSVLPWACTMASDVEVLEIRGQGNLFGQVYLDLDGTRVLSGGDVPIAGAEVTLSDANDGSVFATTTSNGAGIFAIEAVPLGSYRLSLPESVLGDSLVLLGGGVLTVANAENQQANVGGGFPILRMSDVVTAPEGLRVVTSGIALNPRMNFDDGQVHFSGDTLAYLRTINTTRVTIDTGDSVRLVGRRVTDNGRPALDSVSTFVVLTDAALVVPVETQTGPAANASGGSLDAALVVVRDVAISDTASTPEGDFTFRVNDGSGALEVVIRPFLGISPPDVPPTSISRLVGLLSPIDDGSGSVRWRLLPRSDDDIDP